MQEEDNSLTLINRTWGGTPPLGYGPASKQFFKAYTTTTTRQEDLQDTDKAASDTDTSADSDPEATADKQMTHKHQTRGLTRQEMKQLDRELPWRQILSMPAAYVDKFLAAINKEADSWSEWQSVRPLSHEEAQAVLRDKILSKRILRSRACYRDKNCGQGEVKAKCRIVCLGHQDPDLGRLSRTSPTPGRCAEMILYAMLVAGYNKELFDTEHSWVAWAGDAATAFLQGRQKDSERPLPLYMHAPKDGLISMTSCWSHSLYQILGNVYGLSNAPHLWTEEIVNRLSSKGYERHDFDRMMFLRRNGQGLPVSVILVYVDDFIGIHRSDYDVSEVQDLFKWGDLKQFELNVPVLFKGKELTLKQNQDKRYVLDITMGKFIKGLESGKIPRGRAKDSLTLTPNEHREFRSVAGCLQWAATQCRPEIAPAISLSNHGQETTIKELRDLYEALDYLITTPHQGMRMQDLPFGKGSMLLAFSDASWANASRSGSQIGVIIGLTEQAVKQRPAKFSPLDWRSCRSPRVCRSTLAAEASAADESADRSAFLNMMISEIVYGEPSHRVGCRIAFAQATDAKSLYDAVIADAPNITDRRSLVNIRAIQENVDSSRIHWIPTRCQFADGLTKMDQKLREIFRSWLQDPFAILVEHLANEGLLSFIEANVKKKKTSEKVDQFNPLTDCPVDVSSSKLGS